MENNHCGPAGTRLSNKMTPLGKAPSPRPIVPLSLEGQIHHLALRDPRRYFPELCLVGSTNL